jgi:CRP/FNR family cyclic AMP-dependent transcriptional regulator
VTAPSNDLFNVPGFLESFGVRRNTVPYSRGARVFRQGEACGQVFYLQEGSVKLSVTSRDGRDAIVAVIGPDNFFGEGCLSGQTRYTGSATAATDCRVLVVAKEHMLRLLHTEHAVSSRFIAHLLARSIRTEENLIDQMFNSSEKRLARALLLLARYDTHDHIAADQAARAIPPMTQEALAEMIGATRSRVNVFMKKFEQLGFIDCSEGLKIRPSLFAVITPD